MQSSCELPTVIYCPDTYSPYASSRALLKQRPSAEEILKDGEGCLVSAGVTAIDAKRLCSYRTAVLIQSRLMPD